MITLYGVHSPYVYKVRLALLKKGLEFKHVSVNLMEKSKDFLQLAPLGKIPALKDGDTVMYGSSNIVQYLDEQYKETEVLTGKTVAEKVKIGNLDEIVTKISSIIPPIFLESMGLINKTDKTSFGYALKVYSDDEEKMARSDLTNLFELLAAELGGKKYFVGESLSVADFSIFSFLAFAKKAKIDTSVLDNWYNQHAQTDVFAEILAKEDEIVGEV